MLSCWGGWKTGRIPAWCCWKSLLTPKGRAFWESSHSGGTQDLRTNQGHHIQLGRLCTAQGLPAEGTRGDWMLVHTLLTKPHTWRSPLSHLLKGLSLSLRGVPGGLCLLRGDTFFKFIQKHPIGWCRPEYGRVWDYSNAKLPSKIRQLIVGCLFKSSGAGCLSHAPEEGRQESVRSIKTTFKNKRERTGGLLWRGATTDETDQAKGVSQQSPGRLSKGTKRSSAFPDVPCFIVWVLKLRKLFTWI